MDFSFQEKILFAKYQLKNVQELLGQISMNKNNFDLVQNEVIYSQPPPTSQQNGTLNSYDNFIFTNTQPVPQEEVQNGGHTSTKSKRGKKAGTSYNMPNISEM